MKSTKNNSSKFTTTDACCGGIVFVFSLSQSIHVDKERIHWWDLHRIFIGQAPLEFLLEVFIRSLILYVMAIVIMRWLGKRMNGQVSILELAIMVMMGATLGASIEIPDRGILQALVIFLAILALLRLVNLLAFRSSKAERILNGSLSV